MSRGPGHVQEAIAKLLRNVRPPPFSRAKPTLTTSQICAYVFQVRRSKVTKSHRVAVLRAMPSVLERRRNWEEIKPAGWSKERRWMRTRRANGQREQEQADDRARWDRLFADDDDEPGDAAVALALLDLPPGSKSADVERQFRIRSKQLHPDHGGDVIAFRALVLARNLLTGRQPDQGSAAASPSPWHIRRARPGGPVAASGARHGAYASCA